MFLHVPPADPARRIPNRREGQTGAVEEVTSGNGLSHRNQREVRLIEELVIIVRGPVLLSFGSRNPPLYLPQGSPEPLREDDRFRSVPWLPLRPWRTLHAP